MMRMTKMPMLMVMVLLGYKMFHNPFCTCIL